MNANVAISSITSTLSAEGFKAGMISAGSGAYTAVTTVGSVAFSFFKCYTLYNMYESAFSDILCLKTLRHGTSPYAAARIAWTGPDLERSGKEGEAGYYQTIRSDSPWAQRDQDRKAFYVVEDFSTDVSIQSLFSDYISTKITIKYYALRSSVTFFGSMLPLPKSWKARLIKGSVYVIENEPRFRVFGLLCPSVKFHINPNRIQISDDELSCSITSQEKDKIFLVRDRGGGEGALYTKHQFSVLDIGVLGIIKNGINRDIFKRIDKNRSQFLWGVAQLVVAAAFTALFFPGIIPGSWVIIAGVASIVALQRFGKLGVLAIALVLGPPILYAGAQF